VDRASRHIGVDLAGLLGGRMARAEGGSVSSGVAYGEGCPLSSRLRGLGERREIPQWGFWRIGGLVMSPCLPVIYALC